MPRCMADNKLGRRCGNEPLPGTKYCLSHKNWAAHSEVRNGRYAKAIGKFREAYQESLHDQTLLDLKEPIAVLDVVVKRLMIRMSELDSPEFRNAAIELCQRYMSRLHRGDDGAGEVLQLLKTHLQNGAREDQAMLALVKSVRELARRIEGAWEIKLARRNVVNAKDLVGILARVLDIIRTEVSTDVYARVVERVDVEVMSGAGRSALSAARMTAIPERVEPREAEIENGETQRGSE